MAYKPIRMDIVNQIQKLHEAGQSIRGIGRMLNISKNTVKKYLKIIAEQTSSHESIIEPSQVYSHHYLHSSDKKEKLLSLLPEMNKRLSLVGMTKEIIWKEYRENYPDGYSYGEFCRQFKAYKTASNPTLNIEHKLGQYMQVDFAGKKLKYYIDGIEKQADVLICTLPASRLMYVIALESQKIFDFVYGITKALTYFGGSPKVVLSDNLRSLVTKSDRYCPTFTQLCTQLSIHYEFELDSTRVAKPKDKGSVERNVRLAYQNVYAYLHDTKPQSLQELNSLIIGHLTTYNNKCSDGFSMSRMEYFLQHEKPTLKQLPAKEFDIAMVTKAKVQRDYHVLLGKDNHFYSVPYRYIGQQTEIVFTKSTVEIFIGMNRIAVHPRNSTKGRTTIENHCPEKHLLYLAHINKTPQDYIEQSLSIGCNTHWAMSFIMGEFKNNPKYHKIAEGILAIARHHSNQRLETICTYIRPCGTISLQMINNVLTSNIDNTILVDQDAKPIPLHENIRGAKHYT